MHDLVCIVRVDTTIGPEQDLLDVPTFVLHICVGVYRQIGPIGPSSWNRARSKSTGKHETQGHKSGTFLHVSVVKNRTKTCSLSFAVFENFKNVTSWHLLLMLEWEMCRMWQVKVSFQHIFFLILVSFLMIPQDYGLMASCYSGKNYIILLL